MKTHGCAAIFCWAFAIRLACGVASAAGPRLSLHVEGGNGPVSAGDVVVVALVLQGIGEQQAAGFQAFLEFDPARLAAVEAAYTAEPFALPVLVPIAIGEGTIDLAAGIDVLNGAAPVSEDAALAMMEFLVLEDSLCVSAVAFRANEPPTLVSDAFGEAIEPLTLVGLAGGSSADLTGDGAVGVADLLELLAQWGECPPGEACFADLTCDGKVGVPDLLVLLASWGSS